MSRTHTITCDRCGYVQAMQTVVSVHGDPMWVAPSGEGWDGPGPNDRQSSTAWIQVGTRDLCPDCAKRFESFMSLNTVERSEDVPF